MRKPLICLGFICMMSIGIAKAQEEEMLLSGNLTENHFIELEIGYMNSNPDCVKASLEKHRVELLEPWKEAWTEWSALTLDTEMVRVLDTLLSPAAIVQISELTKLSAEADLFNQTRSKKEKRIKLLVCPLYEEETITLPDAVIKNTTIFLKADTIGQFSTWLERIWDFYLNVHQTSVKAERRRPLSESEIGKLHDDFLDMLAQGIAASTKFDAYKTGCNFTSSAKIEDKIEDVIQYIECNLGLKNQTTEFKQTFANELL